MPDTLPEPYATIASLRRENRMEREIAVALNICTDELARTCRIWQRTHPDQPLPLPTRRRRAAQAAQIRALCEEGLDRDAIAREMGLPEPRFKHLWWFSGCRATQQRQADKTGRRLYTNLRYKGAVPPLGTIGTILDSLTPAETTRLLARIGRADDTLAETLAILLKEYLDAPEQPRAG